MRLPIIPLAAVAVVFVIAAGPAAAAAATSAQSSIRFAWSQQITFAGSGDTRACRYMTEDYRRLYAIGTKSYADCPAAIKGRYAEDLRDLGRTALARQTRADAAAARRTKISVTGASARGRLRATVGDCTRTQSQKFKRVNGRWRVDIVTANTATLGCLR